MSIQLPISFGNLIEHQWDGVFRSLLDGEYEKDNGHIENSFLSDMTLQIGNHEWKLHSWIIDLRLCKIPVLTDPVKDLLNRTTSISSLLILRWVYMDKFELPQVCSSLVDLVIAFGEVAYVFHKLEKSKKIVEHWLHEFHTRLIALTKSSEFIQILSYLIRYPWPSLHNILSCYYSKYVVLDMEANGYELGLVWFDHLERIKNTISKDQLEKVYAIFQDYIDLNEVPPVNPPNDRKVAPYTMRDDLVRYAENRSCLDASILCGEDPICFNSSILWSQCQPLRSYITENKNERAIDMSSKKISLDMWKRVVHYYHILDTKVFEEISSVYDIFYLYEFLYSSQNEFNGNSLALHETLVERLDQIQDMDSLYQLTNSEFPDTIDIDFFKKEFCHLKQHPLWKVIICKVQNDLKPLNIRAKIMANVLFIEYRKQIQGDAC